MQRKIICSIEKSFCTSNARNSRAKFNSHLILPPKKNEFSMLTGNTGKVRRDEMCCRNPEQILTYSIASSVVKGIHFQWRQIPTVANNEIIKKIKLWKVNFSVTFMNVTKWNFISPLGWFTKTFTSKCGCAFPIKLDIS